MSLVKEAFERLYPGRPFIYDAEIRYSGRFKAFGANVRKLGNKLEVGLSKKWRGINREVLVGLVQLLLLKILKDKETRRTLNMELYNSFIKNLHLISPKTRSDPVLEAAFNRVNDKYFFSGVEKPNLCWGSASRRTLAHYDYHTDTVTVSKLFMNANGEVVDYLMFHELLHKRLKFYDAGSRNHHHTREFKGKERAFENLENVEKEINAIIRKGRFLSFFLMQKL